MAITLWDQAVAGCNPIEEGGSGFRVQDAMGGGVRILNPEP
jgi:hypothetical protein